MKAHQEFTTCIISFSSSRVLILLPFLLLLLLLTCEPVHSHIASECNQLEEIDLTSCWQLEEETVMQLISRCERLHSLSLSRIYGITDRTIRLIASHSHFLTHVDVSGCWNVSDQSLRYITCVWIFSLSRASLTHVRQRRRRHACA